jgi:hypothetical protein
MRQRSSARAASLIILGALLWMADKLKSNQGEQARALWAAKGREAFAVERATDAPTISQEMPRGIGHDRWRVLIGAGSRRRSAS